VIWSLGLGVGLWVCTAPVGFAQTLQDLLGQPAGSGGVASVPVETRVTVSLRPEASSEVSPEPAADSPAGTFVLTLTIQMPPGAYTYSQNPSFGGATRITVAEVSGLEPIDDQFQADRKPKVEFEEVFGQNLEKFSDAVTLSRRYRLTGAVPADQVYIAGELDFQVCDAKSCIPLHETFEAFPESTTAAPPDALSSAVPSGAGEPEAPRGSGMNVMPVAERNAESPPETAPPSQELTFALEPAEGHLGSYLLAAFLGGLILNVMPCVLPVLAIKIMSFVQQAGESRSRILLLNVSYSLGVIGVFLVLASLAVTLNLGWGGLFQRPEFNLAMIGIVFAMGLSMLGVFEIPIPGMVGAVGGQQREGPAGAFATGIFATLLATPCSGPFMTSALAWSVKQDPQIVYLVWGVMGLGMASPYLLVGLFPSLVNWLPRPGMWMVWFKELSGFALLAATLWLMGTLPAATVLPVLIMLFGLGLSLWMFGRLATHSAPPQRRALVLMGALAVAVTIGWYGMTGYRQELARAEAAPLAMAPGEASAVSNELPWEPFSGERLMALIQEGKPVLVDFTADWCLICKTNEKVALNTSKTAAFVRTHGVVPLYADFTREDPEIKAWLAKFNSISVPLTVIFPEDDPQRPIILDGPYTQSQLLESLREAVTSVRTGDRTAEPSDRQSSLADRFSR
jgi:thiol:disulfide interchange protein DsbD